MKHDLRERERERERETEREAAVAAATETARSLAPYTSYIRLKCTFGVVSTDSKKPCLKGREAIARVSERERTLYPSRDGHNKLLAATVADCLFFHSKTSLAI